MNTATLAAMRLRLVRTRSNFGGIIPPALVPGVRSYFTSQGITGSAISDSGDIDPQAIIALVYDEVEFRSRLFPPGKVVYNLKDTTPGPARALLKFTQPAIILKSKAHGDRVLFAPYGVPTETASEIKAAAANIGFSVGAVALGLVLGGVALYRWRR